MLLYYFGLMPLGNLMVIWAARRNGSAGVVGVITKRSRRATAIAGVRVDVAGLEHLPREGGFVLNYNECSLIDVLAFNQVFWLHANRGVGAEEFARIPGMRRACDLAGIVLFKRGDREAAARLLKNLTADVAKGDRLAMGGEGRLSWIDGVAHFKRGGALIAIQAGVPIVPVCIQGGYHLMKKGSLRVRRGTVRFRFGEPISSAGRTDDDAADLASSVEEAVSALYDAARREAASA